MLGLVNEKTLKELAWSQLCGELAARARTPMGRERCLALLPGDDADEARRRLARVEEGGGGGRGGGGGPRCRPRPERDLPLADAVDVRPSLGRAQRDGTLEPQEL